MKKMIGMRKILVLLALCGLMFAACEKNDGFSQAPDDLFGLITDDSEAAETKAKFTSTSGSTFTQMWELNDQLSVFWKNNTNLFYNCVDLTAQTNGNLKYTQFKLYSDIPSGWTETDSNGIYAIYPYDSANSISGTGGSRVLSFTVPTTQGYVQNNYGKATKNGNLCGCAVLVAKENFNRSNHGKGENYLDFFNVGCWIKLDLKATRTFSVKKIVMNSTGIAGTSTISFPTSGTAGSMRPNNPTAGSVNSVTLTCGTAVTLGSTATSFYIYLLPKTLSSGSTFVITDNASTPLSVTLKINGTPTLQRNVVYQAAATIGDEISYSVSVNAWNTASGTMEFK